MIFTIVMLFNFSSFLIMWVCIELNICVFVTFLFFIGKDYNLVKTFNECFFYLIIQSLARFIFILSFRYSWRIDANLIRFLILRSLCFKICIPPFHSWFYDFCKTLSNESLFVILTLQKFPFFFFCGRLELDEIFILGFLRIFVGTLNLINCTRSVDFIISSSIYSFFWVILIIVQRFFLGAANLIFYTVFIFYFCLRFIPSQIFDSFSKIIFCFLGLYFLSLPPFNMFFFKIFRLGFVYDRFSTTTFLFIWIFSFFSIFGYLKFFYFFIIKLEGIYKNLVFSEGSIIFLIHWFLLSFVFFF